LPLPDIAMVAGEAGDGLRELTRRIREPRRAVIQVSAHRLDLVRATDQRALFIGFGLERGKSARRNRLIEQPFGSADRIRAAPRDIAGDSPGLAERISGEARGEPVGERVLRGEDPPRIGQLSNNVFAGKRAHELRAGHIRHETPLALDQA
jgi:hypothetical protein